MDSVKRDGVASGLAWKFGERLGAQLITLLVAMYLKNLLGPEQYGAVNMVTIFITIANVFVTGGLSSGLVQKKDGDELDFSTVFHFNLALSLVIYMVLFAFSPLIAALCGMEVICPVLRVLGLRIPLAAVNSVQQAYVSRNMFFRKFFISTLTGTIISGIVGIATAVLGFGVWALVLQYLTNSAISTLVLFVTIKWRPKLIFSMTRLKGLLSYGWKLVASGFIETGYTQLRAIIIGLKYSESDLSLYQNGNEYPQLLAVNASSSISAVLFPVISGHQKDIKKVRELTRQSIRIGAYLMFPAMVGFGVVCPAFFDVFFESEWQASADYCRLACIVYSLWPIHTANLEAIKSLGRSDIYLWLEVVKKAVGISILFFTINSGVYSIALGGVAATLISSAINAFPNKKLLDYGYIQQMKDILPPVFYSAVMAVFVYLTGKLPLSPLPLLLLQVAVGIIVYIAVSLITKSSALAFLAAAVRKKA